MEGTRLPFDTAYGSSVIAGSVILPPGQPATTLPGTQQLCGPCSGGKGFCPLHNESATKAAGANFVVEGDVKKEVETIGKIVGDFLDKIVDVVAERVVQRVTPMLQNQKPTSFEQDHRQIPDLWGRPAGKTREEAEIDPAELDAVALHSELAVLRYDWLGPISSLKVFKVTHDDDLLRALFVISDKGQCIVQMDTDGTKADPEGLIRLQVVFKDQSKTDGLLVDAAKDLIIATLA
jgi:hypothetical protein